MRTRFRALAALALGGALFLGVAMPAAAADAKAMVRAAHLIPDAPAVDVLVNGGVVLEDVTFKAVSDYLMVDAGTYTISINAAGTADRAPQDRRRRRVRQGLHGRRDRHARRGRHRGPAPDGLRRQPRRRVRHGQAPRHPRLADDPRGRRQPQGRCRRRRPGEGPHLPRCHRLPQPPGRDLRLRGLPDRRRPGQPGPRPLGHRARERQELHGLRGRPPRRHRRPGARRRRHGRRHAPRQRHRVPAPAGTSPVLVVGLVALAILGVGLAFGRRLGTVRTK